MSYKEEKERLEESLKVIVNIAKTSTLWYCTSCEAYFDDDQTFPPGSLVSGPIQFDTDTQTCQHCLHAVFQEEPYIAIDALRLKIEQVNVMMALHVKRVKQLEQTDPNLEKLLECPFCNGTKKLFVVGNTEDDCLCVREAQ